MLTREPAGLPDESSDIEPEAPEMLRPVASEWSVQMTKLDYSIASLHGMAQEGRLILDPEVARDLVWNERAKSTLIESVLLRIPLPAFYLAEEVDGTLTVLDGRQRLDALFSFMNGQLRLEGLPLLWDLEGKDFQSLDPRLRRRFTDTPLTCLLMLLGTSPELKYEFFLRLNTGASQWSPQELRNSLFRGPGLDLVRDLAGEFRAVAGPGRTFPRMAADELVLRGLAFLALGEARYGGGIQSFSNEALSWLNRLPKEELLALRLRFSTALQHVSTVFGEHAFCRYFPEQERWGPSISRPLVEVLIVGFDQRFPPGTALDPALAPGILDRFKGLYGSPQFLRAVTSATQLPGAVHERIHAWVKELSHVA